MTLCARPSTLKSQLRTLPFARRWVDARVLRDVVDRRRHAAAACVAGRRADEPLHRNELLRDDLAVVEHAFAERDVDAAGHEVGFALVEHELDGDFAVARAERGDQRRDDLAPEAERRADADEPARRAFAKIAHFLERL